MLIKIIGSLAIIGAGVFCAVSLCGYHRRRLETLDGFISLIYYIKGQVECYARPISEIMQSLPPEILRSCNCPRGARTLEELIDESKIFLDREELRLLTSFAGEFGSSFREEQTRRCDHYISMLRDRRAIASERLIPEMRSGSAVCICVSLCLMLLLW